MAPQAHEGYRAMAGFIGAAAVGAGQHPGAARAVESVVRRPGQHLVGRQHRPLHPGAGRRGAVEQHPAQS